MQYVSSERGCPKLVDGPYLFCKDKTVSDKTYWRCEFHEKFRYPARITTIDGKIESKWKSHTNRIETQANIDTVKIRIEVLYSFFFSCRNNIHPIFVQFFVFVIAISLEPSIKQQAKTANLIGEQFKVFFNTVGYFGILKYYLGKFHFKNCIYTLCLHVL